MGIRALVPSLFYHQKELGEQDPFRMRYRNAITENVASVARGCRNKAAAIAFIREYSRLSAPPEDQARLVEAGERDMSLHEGNIARHRIRQAEYEAWHKTWH